MRLSLSLKIALFSVALLTVVVGATTYVLVYRFGQDRARELVAHDRELARVLASLRTDTGGLDFDPVMSFVASADKVNTGLVYAIELDESESMRRGALNTQLFEAIDKSYRQLVRQGEEYALAGVAAGEIERRNKIKEFTLPVPGGHLKLGFDLRRIDRQIAAQRNVGLLILVIGVFLGGIAAVALARSMARPISQLANAMDAVARGDTNQTVEVHSHDELATLADSFNAMMRAVRQLEGIKDLCWRYVPPAVMERVLSEVEPLALPVAEKAVTVMSVRLRGFSQYIHGATPGSSIELANEYLAPLVDTILAHHGVVLTLEEDSAQVVWGAPEDVEAPELHAARAALAMRNAVDDEARRQALAGRPALRLAIGLCTGRAALGHIGSAQRVSYGIVGQVVVAARAAEELAQPGEVIISEATYAKLGERAEVRAAVPLMLDGMDEALPLYRLNQVDA